MVSIPKLPDIGSSKEDKKTYRIRTPHAAMIVWNYNDRGGFDGISTANVDKINRTDILTTSVISMTTSKSKSDPQGEFQVMLTPDINWVSAITPGSWCAILMSTSPITKDDFQSADPKKIKMIGKIDTVRVGAKVDDGGARNTAYYISGVDWGHIFHNSIYFDNNIAKPSDPKNLGNASATSIQDILFGKDNVPKRFSTKENIEAIVHVFGQDLAQFATIRSELKVLPAALYNFKIPKEMLQYFRFINSSGFPSVENKLNSCLNVVTGALNKQPGGKSSIGKYEDTKESAGFLDPFSLEGSHSFWQVLMDNSNPTLNEMIAEMDFTELGTKLVLYNRIKPFIVRGTPTYLDALSSASTGANGLKTATSFFQNIPFNYIDSVSVIEVNAGTNWKDKYNFIEVRPLIAETAILEASIKPDLQVFDIKSFEREGFRPLIFGGSKYLPPTFFEGASQTKAAIQDIAGWLQALKLWYFDTHKMLNGTITFTGQDQYIPVGNNIKFKYSLITPKPNMNAGSTKFPLDIYVLAHVESVSNSFTVRPDGGRDFITSVQFVRGIIVNDAGLPIDIQNPGIDTKSNSISINKLYGDNITYNRDASDPKRGK